ncbi:hypothetical protein AAFF_G00131250 [Aldrovandia affinis]|uniref:Uncharacterized protein n=1 Tax=Aldrovandia affinis TaxID=143900 RepID=A0AAD7RTH9_9TELE|nr:hypothetical protein AAFF_G00131250 [Aldrovandia affinis]
MRRGGPWFLTITHGALPRDRQVLSGKTNGTKVSSYEVIELSTVRAAAAVKKGPSLRAWAAQRVCLPCISAVPRLPREHLPHSPVPE